ncbi:MAG: DNA polymerase I [Bacteroidetes bacterium MedPE-SWsnd-G1]|nr:MAG: DNA polymerase I [Bacteroidetes bacterium MedPE-SWsnd-G1]
MPEQKRLFLLDAFALIFRGYYALIKNPRINSKGMDTSAILGFTNSLLDVIRREKPDHLAVAFDKGGSSARVEAFPEYKANRQETPEAIKIAVPYIHKILEAMNIPIIEVAGIEADDLIGTLSVQADKAGYKTFMVTPDKDYAQLVTDNVVMYRPARMGNGIEIWDVEKVKEKFEIEDPKQVIDYLGMMGDAVDNIPGLPGVGDKTAKKFLKAYGSMEGLLANTHELKGKMKEKVEANKELGLLSKQLATIILDCPVQFHEENFELSTPDFQAVSDIFQELEFRRTFENFQRIFKAPTENKTEEKTTPVSEAGGNAPSTSQLDLFAAPSDAPAEVITGFQEAKNTNHFYQHINNKLAQNLLLKKLMQQKSVCFDTETTSLNTFEAQLVGIAFSFEKGKGYYLPIPEDKNEALVILDKFKAFFENDGIEKIGQNIKYDIKVLSNYSIEVKGPIFDTMLAHYLINPDMRHNMNVLAESYLNYQPISIESLIGKKGKNQKTMRDVSVEDQTEYAVEDADITFQLKQVFEKELKENGLTKLFSEIEIPLLKVLAKMEIEGINVDADFLNSLSEDLNKDILELETSIYGEAAVEFNLASPKQLGEVLFDHLKLVDKPKKTKTGQYKTSEDVLSYLANDHEIVANILKWRGLVKLKNTYVDALPNEINSETNRIHTTYSQAVAATGRLSSNNPNLQNIPIRTERGQQVRKAFVPRDKNYTLLAADYSQIELRLIAELSGDETMKSSFLNGEDIHRATAAKVFDVALDEVTREQRSHAKTVNFGIIYGVSAFGLSNQTNLSRKESKALIDTYYETYPTLKAYIAKQIDFARDNGYVETLLGRRRYLKNINSQNAIVRGAAERNAVNAPIQGSAADIIKIAMINIQNRFEKENYKSKMLLQVHDELVFDIHKDELEILKPIIKDEMENAYKLSIPLDVDMDMGDNWLDAH